MKVSIQQELCISCSLCSQVCPQIIKMNEDGIAQVFREGSKEDLPAIKDAIENCPVACILITK